VKTVLIISGKDASILVPKICEDCNGNGLNKVPNISGIVVFCRDEKAHKQWASKYPLITLVSNSHTDVLDEADRLL
jgi:ribosomal protein L36